MRKESNWSRNRCGGKSQLTIPQRALRHNHDLTRSQPSSHHELSALINNPTLFTHRLWFCPSHVIIMTSRGRNLWVTMNFKLSSTWHWFYVSLTAFDFVLHLSDTFISTRGSSYNFFPCSPQLLLVLSLPFNHFFKTGRILNKFSIHSLHPTSSLHLDRTVVEANGLQERN